MPTFRDDIANLLPQLRAFARVLAAGDTALADDLVQETVVRALQAEAQFTPGTNLRAWLYSIMHNQLRSLARRWRFVGELPPEEIERRLVTPGHHSARLEAEEFKRAFAKLSPMHREALILAGIHGMSYPQIAEVCGCEVGTVKSRISRSRSLLKAMLLGDETVAAVEASAQAPRVRQRTAVAA